MGSCRSWRNLRTRRPQRPGVGIPGEIEKRESVVQISVHDVLHFVTLPSTVLYQLIFPTIYNAVAAEAAQFFFIGIRDQKDISSQNSLQ